MSDSYFQETFQPQKSTNFIVKPSPIKTGAVINVNKTRASPDVLVSLNESHSPFHLLKGICIKLFFLSALDIEEHCYPIKRHAWACENHKKMASFFEFLPRPVKGLARQLRPCPQCPISPSLPKTIEQINKLQVQISKSGA